MAGEVLKYLVVKDGPVRFIDGTVGGGGHSSLILKKNLQAEVLGIDRDNEALARARTELSFAQNRIHLCRGQFSRLTDFAERNGWRSVDGILLDLGVSSLQLDDPERGFSHRLDGPLDMRMDRRSARTACRLLNQAPAEELAGIFREYGEIREHRRLAAAIVARRAQKPWSGTLELAALCEAVLGKSVPGKLPRPTLCFQALRLAVNDELAELDQALAAALALLVPGGRLAVISFHSLEDRMVKQFFQVAARDCVCPPGLPICVCKHRRELQIITRKPLRAAPEEVRDNRRAAPAKLRVAEKIGGKL
jgi:16S rRNA (cytosine1402-N4)-methyltransferase